MAATLTTPTSRTVSNPTHPDFFHCNHVYGTGIHSDGCIPAAVMLLNGNSAIPFIMDPEDAMRFSLYVLHGKLMKFHILHR